MKPTMPPPSPRTQRTPLERRSKILIGFVLINAVLVGVFIVLRTFGLIRPFSISSGGMAATISRGDHVMMEGITFLARKPRRGDVVVFKADGIDSLPPGTLYVKRVAGEPTEHLRISD